MWTYLIEKIPERQLTTWSTCANLLAYFVFPILIGLCGYAATKISDRISNLKEISSRKIIDDLNTSLTTTQALATLLQQKQAPWVLSRKQKDTFSTLLKDAPRGKVGIEHISSDGKRSHDFAVVIENLLKAAGYEVSDYMPAFQQASGAPLIGVQIQIKDRQSEVVGGYIQRAFKGIGIDAGGVHRTNNNYEDDFVVILIGIKP